MGLLDKAMAKGQELAAKGQEKLAETQEMRRKDALLRDLGAAVFAEKTGRGTGETAAEIERLVAELREVEEAEAARPPRPTGGESAATAEPTGNFTLDDV